MCGQEREWESKVIQEQGEKPDCEEEGCDVGSWEENVQPGSPHGAWRPSEMLEPSSQGGGRNSHSRRVAFDPRETLTLWDSLAPFLSGAFSSLSELLNPLPLPPRNLFLQQTTVGADCSEPGVTKEAHRWSAFVLKCWWGEAFTRFLGCIYFLERSVSKPTWHSNKLWALQTKGKALW